MENLFVFLVIFTLNLSNNAIAFLQQDIGGLNLQEILQQLIFKNTNFTGTHCETECLPPRVILPPNATAAAEGECVCPKGKTGDLCELEVLENCFGEDGKCQNGGQCVPAGQKTICICPTGFSGPSCDQRSTTPTSWDDTAAVGDQLDKDDQGTVNGRKCQNGGQCVQQRQQELNGENSISAHCKCTINFIGVWCEQDLGIPAEQHTVDDRPPKRTVDGSAETTTADQQREEEENGAEGADQQEVEEGSTDYVEEVGILDGHNNEKMMSNCSECLNGAKCVRVEQQQRIRCLCSEDFVGLRCDIKKPLFRRPNKKCKKNCHESPSTTTEKPST